MSTNHHTAISAGAAANAATINTPLGQIDAALSDILNTDLTMKDNAVDRTAVLANDVVTLAKLQNIAEGSIIVGGAASEPTLLSAKGAGKILVGNGTTITSVAMSGDATLAADGTLTLTAALEADAIGIVNLAPDAFFQHTYPGVLWGGRTRWQGISEENPAALIVADPNNPYGGNTLRHLSTSGTTMGPAIWMDELPAGADEDLIVKVALNWASGTLRVYVAFRDIDGGVVGSTFNSGLLTGTGAEQIAEIAATVQTDAAYMLVYSQRFTAAVDIDWHALWITKGTYSADFPTPSVNLSPILAQSYLQSGWDYNLKTFTVGTVDCDYSTIADALAALTTANLPTMINRCRLLLAEETFVEYELNIVGMEYLVIEGMGRDQTIIDGTLGANDLTKDTFKVASNCIFRNLTIKAHNVKYCTHIDYTENAWTVTFENCRLFHDTGFCIGAGLHGGQNIVAKNCIFEFGGTSPTWRWGVFVHNWNQQSLPVSIRLENCRFDNCGVVTMKELGSFQVDHIYIINCKSNLLAEGIDLDVTATYLGVDPWDVPYCWELHVAGYECAYFSVDATNRPDLDWHIPGWDTHVKNVNGSTLVAGKAVAYSYTASGARSDVDLSQNRCDGVLLADIPTTGEGWMVMRGRCVNALVDATVAQGAWLKPDATGTFTAATETTALAVAMAARTGAGSVKVRLL